MSADNLMSDAVMVPALRLHAESAEVIKALKAEARRTGKGVPEDYPGLHKTLWTAALIIEQAEEAFAINLAWSAASTPVGGWEDISTAPKTDEANMVALPILGWFPAGEAVDGGDQRVCWWEPKLKGGTWWSDRDIGETPALWTALPPPPSVSTGSRPQEAILPQTEKGS